MKIYLQQDGNQTGPFDESVVRERLNQGGLTAEVYAWGEGMNDWRPLGEIMSAAPTHPAPSFVQTMSAAPVAAASPPANTKMPWWGKLLLSGGGLLAVGMIALAVVIVYALHQDQVNHGGSSPGKSSADWATFDKEMADLREQGKTDRTNLQAEIERNMVDAEHYTTAQTHDPDGGTTTTITPKSNNPGGKPTTKRVDADGKITTTTVDADGNTVIRTEDKNGNVSTVTNPK